MKYLLLILLSLNIFAGITQVESGNLITASKINMLISKINELEANQAKLKGQAKWPINTNSVWAMPNGITSYSSFPDNTNAATPIVSGDIVVPDKSKLKFTIKNAKLNKAYNITITGFFYITGGSNAYFALFKEGEKIGYVQAHTTESNSNGTYHGVFISDTNGDIILELKAFSSSGNAKIHNDGYDRRLEITVVELPTIQ